MAGQRDGAPGISEKVQGGFADALKPLSTRRTFWRTSYANVCFILLAFSFSVVITRVQEMHHHPLHSINDNVGLLSNCEVSRLLDEEYTYLALQDENVGNVDKHLRLFQSKVWTIHSVCLCMRVHVHRCAHVRVGGCVWVCFGACGCRYGSRLPLILCALIGLAYLWRGVWVRGCVGECVHERSCGCGRVQGMSVPTRVCICTRRSMCLHLHLCW